MDNNNITNNNENIEEKSLYDSVKVLSPTRLVLRRFFRSRLSIIGLGMLLFLFIFSFIGPLFISYNDTETFAIERQVQMISKESFKGSDGVTYEFFDVSKSITTDKAPPSSDHWLGTDNNRMDVFTRLMYGGRVSLMISFLVIFFETFLGVFFGGIAGYFGKWIDTLIMRVVDIFYCLPTMPILLISAQIIKSIESIQPNHRIIWLMGILTLFGWASTARLVRGQILSLREQEFMTAAEATGIKASAKIVKHLLPNVMPQLIVTMTLGLGGVILYESTLSYLGLGVQFPFAAWGTMISAADPSKGSEILSYYPNLWIAPGVLIVAAVLGFNFVGDGLRDAFDPKMKR
ncbi:MAG: ABC transporter permease [Clostridiales bacterium GWF2_36_10]|nr:MAG: ABC transporter permease [Clostridiales bacterium GWF2_36_10]HAN21407.1 ABC transporter permease [Clostridiales bacterium]